MKARWIACAMNSSVLRAIALKFAVRSDIDVVLSGMRAAMTELRLTAVMKTDISGSTARYRALTVPDLSASLGEHRDLITRLAMAQNGRVIGGVFGPARKPADAPPPGGSSVVGVPDAGGRDGERQACRISRMRADRMKAETSAAALPPRAAGLVPQCPIQLPGATAVVAAKQRRGGDAGPEDTIFGPRFDDPGAGDGRLHIFGKHGSLGLLPVAGHVPAEVDAGAELAAGNVLGHFLRPVCDGGEIMQCMRRFGFSVMAFSKHRAAISRGPPRSPRSTNSPFLVPTSTSVSATSPSFRSRAGLESPLDEHLETRRYILDLTRAKNSSVRLAFRGRTWPGGGGCTRPGLGALMVCALLGPG